MQVILLERVAKLGQMGDVVKVREGYARNFLLPQGKALRASEANKQAFESQKAQLEARNLETRKEAETLAAKLDGTSHVVIRSASEAGALYGSVTPRDIADALAEAGFTVERKQIVLNAPIKALGLHEVGVALASRGRRLGDDQRRALERRSRAAGIGQVDPGYGGRGRSRRRVRNRRTVRGYRQCGRGRRATITSAADPGQGAPRDRCAPFHIEARHASCFSRVSCLYPVSILIRE
jgi:ribosomal protein L9